MFLWEGNQVLFVLHISGKNNAKSSPAYVIGSINIWYGILMYVNFAYIKKMGPVSFISKTSNACVEQSEI